MDYQHLTTFERGRIEALNKLGYNVREIGKCSGQAFL
jgi:IS30 family transposase